MDFEILQQYVKNIREIFEQKLAEMQMFQDRQASEIEALTNKIMMLGFIVILLIVVIIILAIVLKASSNKRKRHEIEEREAEIKREEKRLREERRKFAEQQERQVRKSQVWPENPEGAPRTEYGRPSQPEYGQPSQPEYGRPSQPEYGQPSRREYSGRQDDKAAREAANQDTQYFGNPDEWQ